MNLITQEAFEKMTPRVPRKLNPEVPPPPPPSLAQSLVISDQRNEPHLDEPEVRLKVGLLYNLYQKNFKN